jgi:DNA polymerase elongation subunit (family B)
MLEADSDLAERVLLEELLAALEPYDQVLAWNGDRFDFPFLEERAKQLGVAVEWRRWLLLDHMELCRRMNVSASKSGAEKQSMALAAWAKNVLHEAKVLDLGAGQHVAWKAWLAGGEERERLGAYNVDDTGKMVRIERKTGFVELHQSICEAAGVLPSSRTIGPMQQVETFVMRLGRARGMRFPSFFGYQGGAEMDEDGKLFEGAFVLKPTRLGIIEGVHVCDFSRLYPSIAQTWNLSPETLYRRASEVRSGEKPPPGVCVAPGTGHWFRMEPRGLLPFVFDEMLRQRAIHDDVKKSLPPGSPAWNDADRLSTAYKNMGNAAFGVTGSRWSRLFVVECAESMTLGGAYLIKRVIEEGERVGIETMAGDTDSAFCERVTRPEFEAFIARLNRDVFPAIARESGARECRISLAYEKAFERVVYVSAKHYAGRFEHYKGKAPTEDSKPEVKGLEYKRGDNSVLARLMQAEVLDLLLGGGVLDGSKRRPACESDPEVFRKLVDRWRSRILNRDLDLAEILMSKRLSKEPEHYKRPRRKDGSLGAPPPQVRAALMARERGRDVGAGVRVEYVVADAREKVLVLAEDYDGTNVDRAHLWENLVYPATMRVLQACFPAVKWEAWRRVRQHMGRPGQVRLFEF